MDPLARNPRRYLWFSALVHTPLFVPVLVLFWTDNGLSMLDIYVLQTAYAAATVALEVPTGVVADRIGKRTSLLLAVVLFAASLGVYALGAGFWVFLLAELGLAVAGAFLSGADSALLYDSLAALGRQDEFRRWAGRGSAVQLGSFAVANVVGGLVGAWSTRATLALSVVGPVLAGLVVLTMVEARRPATPDQTVREGLRAWWALLAGAVRFVSRHQRVRWLLVFLAVLNGSATWLLWLYQPYLAFSGLPVWAFGLVFALYNLWAAAMSALSHRVAGALGERTTLLALGLLQLLPLPLMATLVGPASFLLVLGHQTVRGLGRPFLSDAVLAHTWADKRATVLSLGGLGSRLFFAVTGPLVGLAAEVLTLPEALWVQSALLGSLLLVLGVGYLRIPSKYQRVKPDRST